MTRLELPKLSENKEQESLSELNSLSKGLVEDIENKAEFVNEQKENIKIVYANVQNSELFLERLALLFHLQNCRKRIFYGLKRHKKLKQRKHLRKKIETFMTRRRKLETIFGFWRNWTFNNKKTRLGKQMILSFKVAD